jgi:hypothetical protein
MKFIVVSREPNGDTSVRYAEEVKHIEKHIDGCPVLLVDFAPYWTGQHEVRAENGAIVLSIDLGSQSEAKSNAQKRFYERVRPTFIEPNKIPTKRWFGI